VVAFYNIPGKKREVLYYSSVPDTTLKTEEKEKLYWNCFYFRRILAFYSSVFSVLSTGFLVMHPAANAFALMILGLPAIGFLYKELVR
jgi:hypothetical protein